ncbi:hypothetical protein DFH29DRAFT_1073835 [Suillus ampliporus]|nr:hypothetical protein DFH29DRAFT_1073835 [Suillus ampliporus]
MKAKHLPWRRVPQQISLSRQLVVILTCHAETNSTYQTTKGCTGWSETNAGGRGMTARGDGHKGRGTDTNAEEVTAGGRPQREGDGRKGRGTVTQGGDGHAFSRGDGRGDGRKGRGTLTRRIMRPFRPKEGLGQGGRPKKVAWEGGRGDAYMRIVPIRQ